MEKLDYLIEYLLKENKNIKINETPSDEEAKKRLYRSLCNIREPRPIKEEYIKIENEYLQEELQKKEITKIENVKTVADIFPNSTLEYKDKICLWKGDITLLKIDAIVNAANSQGLGCFIPCHKCIDNAIHSSSGVQLRLECNEKMEEIGELETGKAFLTKGYNLPAKYVIHTVGPIIYTSVTEREERQLKECYINSLEIAKENKIRAIAFPCISTGEFRFPKEEACRIAIGAVIEYLRDNEKYFERNFKEYIEKYHFEDLYSASFYDFNTQEEKWAFEAKMIKLNRFNEEPLKLYQELLSLVKNKNYFVITTNVDGQFENAGFDTEKIFAVQGDYALLQCENACHNKTYNNKELEYLLSKWYFKIKIGV